jgi:DNA-binding MarR family transcriptional regulator
VRAKTSLPPGRQTLNLHEFLPYRIAVVAREISASLAKTYADAFGISISEWRVMAHLAEVRTCSSGDICARTAMDKAKVNRAVTRLVAAGLVLAQTSAKDRRLNVLALSRRGRDIYDKIAPIAIARESAITADLSADERTTFLKILDKLHRRVGEVDKSPRSSGKRG